MIKRIVELLLAEDNDADVCLLSDALKRGSLKYHVSRARNGCEALDLLERDDHIPDIALLDINMPKMDGLETLSIIKNMESLQSIPVFILAGQRSNEDRLIALALLADGFITKPDSFNKYKMMVKSIEEFLKKDSDKSRGVKALEGLLQ